MKHLKSLTISVFLICNLLTLPAKLAYANPPVFVTGHDWMMRMNDKEKLIAIISNLVQMSAHGVPFREEPDEYIRLIHEAITNNEFLEDEEVLNIFASTVYMHEPDARIPLLNFMASKEYERRGLRNPLITSLLEQ